MPRDEKNDILIQQEHGQISSSIIIIIIIIARKQIPEQKKKSQVGMVYIRRPDCDYIKKCVDSDDLCESGMERHQDLLIERVTARLGYILEVRQGC